MVMQTGVASSRSQNLQPLSLISWTDRQMAKVRMIPATNELKDWCVMFCSSCLHPCFCPALDLIGYWWDEKHGQSTS